MIIGSNSLNNVKLNTSNNSTIKKFDDFSNSMNPNSTFEYANSTDTQEDIAKKAQQFAEAYINAKGNNDGNIDLAEFISNNTELEKEDAEAIYKMIDIDGRDGITKNEYAAYLMTIDIADGKLDGSMNVEQFNTVGAEAAVLSQEKYNNGFTKVLYDEAKQALDFASNLMQHFNSKYFTSSSDTGSSTDAAAASENVPDMWKNLEDIENGQDNEFSMFDFNASSYSSDLKNHAKETIKNYDTNQDGQLDVNEYLKMVFGDKLDQVSDKLKTTLTKKFESMNLDKDAAKLSAEELATEFFALDCDWSKFAKEGDLTPDAIDGKYKFSDYLNHISMANTDNSYSEGIQTQKKNFYNHFYGEN